MKDHIAKILSGESLGFEEASDAMDKIMSGTATPAQIAGFLIAMKQKGEKAEEVAGLVHAMRKHAVTVDIADDRAVDGCGTGGDQSHSFNISTAAALVTAAAGVSVAKHGNRSVSSQCGSADILEVAGANIDPGPEVVEQNINKLGFGFMFAPRFHPAMKHAAAPRRELGVRTVFNILGPLASPALVKRQVVGVYDKELIPLMADVLEVTGSKHVIVAHSKDGLDEFSVAGSTGYIELRDGQRRNHVIDPEDVGLVCHPREALYGGDPAFNLEILNMVLEGHAGAYRDAVLLNAGAMIYVSGSADSIADGVQVAVAAIDSGQAREKTDTWIKATRTGA